ncbi:ABC transporter substrate-binding protein [Candidatus Gracilibacteria bacterium]|nr:ABC transporter substrate-binding protein [Candidatus Gracilibacteria bacterium]
MKKTLAFIAIIIALAAGHFLSKAALIEDVNISLKWVHQAQFAGMYVAQEEGFYKDNRLKVGFKEFNFDSTPADDLKNGTVEFALMSSEEFLTHVSRGEDFMAVAAFYQISPYALVSLEKGNIMTPADFGGMVLGNKGGKAEEELIYRLLMKEFGLTDKDVEIKTLGFEKREIDDLVDGDADAVDVYRTDQIYFFEKEGVEYNIIYPERYGVNINNDLLVVNRSLINENPEIVENFIMASVEGWEYAFTNPQSAIKSTLKYVTSEEYKDEEYELFILQSSEPLIKPSSRSRIGDISVKNMSDLYEVMKENGFITKDLNISDFYTREYIPY